MYRTSPMSIDAAALGRRRATPGVAHAGRRKIHGILVNGRFPLMPTLHQDRRQPRAEAQLA